MHLKHLIFAHIFGRVPGNMMARSVYFLASCRPGRAILSVLNSRVKRSMAATQRLMAHLDAAKYTQRDMLRQSCFNASMHRVLVAKACLCCDHDLEGMVTVTGWENFAEALAAPKPVILLNSHYGPTRFLPAWLARHGLKVRSVEANNVVQALQLPKPPTLEISSLRSEFFARAAVESARTLAAGGILHILGDGFSFDKKNARSYSLLGKMTPVASGFAELAITFEAVVIPVVVSSQQRGVVNIRFLPALESGKRDIQAQPCAQQVSELLQQYISMLEQLWQLDPGNVSHVKRIEWLVDVEPHRLVPTTRLPS